MSTDRPTTPDGIGLPGWPSKTASRNVSEIAQVGAKSSRQQEREAALEEQHRYCSREEVRHREILAELRRIGDMLLAMQREPR